MSYIGTNKVGKMYLGIKAIGKAYLGSDLVYEASSGAQEPTYVQTNLVFNLDGKNRGGVSGHWIDLVNGVDFTLYNCTENAKSVSFGGSGYGVTSTDLNFPFATHYMELVVAPNFTTPSGYKIVFMTNTNRSLAFGYASNGTIPTTAGNSSRKIVPISKPTDIVQFSISSGSSYSAYINGNSVTPTGEDCWSIKSSGKPAIGCRMNGSTAQDKFNGSIYAIRVYSSNLTDEERLQNLLADNIRFNMGLTI